MKKVLCFLVFLLLCLSSKAQVKYKIEYDVSIEVKNGGNTFATYTVDVDLKALPDNRRYKILRASVTNGFPQNYKRNEIITLPEKANKLLTTTMFSYYPSGSTCDGSVSEEWNFEDSICYRPILYDLNCNNVTSEYFRIYELVPIREVNNYNAATNQIPECEGKKIRITNSLKCSSQQPLYALEYDADGIAGFEGTLLSYGANPIEVDLQLSDFPGLSIGENFNIRYRYTDEPSNNSYSNILTYQFIGCSPKVVNVSPTKTNCSDSTDGGFVLELDRTIEATDALTFDLFIVDNDGANVLEVDPEVIAYRDEIKLIGGKYYYTWPNSLNIGRYRVQFQTNSSAQPEVSPIFRISSPDPVSFTTSSTDIPCAAAQGESQFGTITINATGGNTPYEYQIDDEPWIEFSGSTTVSKEVGTYAIKVRDKYYAPNNGGCVAKNPDKSVKTLTETISPATPIVINGSTKDATYAGRA
ncbi:SprB repeat-containing protein, partial [Aquimarina sp. 2-A2]|uniref:SprB repeat-containing protein n=1 Tax=Aquimarina sp. 2-A2 TaxID=3382644 RepID=UPI00387F2CC5